MDSLEPAVINQLAENKQCVQTAIARIRMQKNTRQDEYVVARAYELQHETLVAASIKIAGVSTPFGATSTGVLPVIDAVHRITGVKLKYDESREEFQEDTDAR